MTEKQPHEAYDAIAETYAAGGEDDPAMRACIREQLATLTPGNRVLEVGCGPGLDAGALAARGMEVTGVDLSSKCIARAQRNYPDVDFRCMDMRAPQFNDGAFDGILGIACFCHLSREEVSDALVCYRRLLCPGGALVLLLMDSRLVDGYVVEDWGGLAGNHVEMLCHDRAWMEGALQSAKFHEMQVIPLSSAHYEAMPRVWEHGIELYMVTARSDVAGAP